MRKLLLIIILVLLLVLGYNLLANGISIGNLNVLGIQQVKNLSESLTAKIEESNKKIDTEYPKKLSDLKTAGKNYDSAESEYLKLTNLSTDEQIIEARTEKSYTIEFLWTKLGVHARNEGVNITFEPVTSSLGANNSNDIKFTVNGSYIAVTNFVYAIENDSELDFRINNFKLLPYQNEILQATFTVPNVTIEGNTSKQNIKQTSTDSNTNTKTNTATNTVNTNTTTNTINTNTTTNTVNTNTTTN